VSIKCRACGHRYDDKQSPTCPECGAEAPRPAAEAEEEAPRGAEFADAEADEPEDPPDHWEAEPEVPEEPTTPAPKKKPKTERPPRAPRTEEPAPTPPGGPRMEEPDRTPPPPSRWPGRLVAAVLGTAAGAAACFGALVALDRVHQPPAPPTEMLAKVDALTKEVAQVKGELDAERALHLADKQASDEAIKAARAGGSGGEVLAKLTKQLKDANVPVDETKPDLAAAVKDLLNDRAELVKARPVLDDVADSRKKLEGAKIVKSKLADGVAEVIRLRDQAAGEATTAKGARASFLKSITDKLTSLKLLTKEMPTEAEILAAIVAAPPAPPGDKAAGILAKITSDLKEAKFPLDEKEPDLAKSIKSLLADRTALQNAQPALQDAAGAGKQLKDAGVPLDDKKPGLSDAVKGLLAEQVKAKPVMTDAANASKQLKEAKVLPADGKDPGLTKAIESLLKDRDTLKKVRDQLQTAKLLPPDEEKADIAKVVEGLLTDRETLQKVRKQLKDAGVPLEEKDSGLSKAIKGLLDGANPEAADTVRTVAEHLAASPTRAGLLAAVDRLMAGTCRSALELHDSVSAALAGAGALPEYPADLGRGVRSLARERNDLLAERDRLEATRRSAEAARQRADAEAKAARDKLLAEKDDLTRTLRAVADKAGTRPERNALLAEVGRLREGRTPEQMLSVWQRILADPDERAFTTEALEDVRRTLEVSAADAGEGELQGRAEFVRGLALRNLGRLDEARAALALALRGEKAGDWRPDARRVMDDLASPADYSLRRARAAHEAGRDGAALALLDQSVKGGGGDGRLLALRALVHLSLGRGEGPLTADSPSVKRAQADAAAAIAAGSAADGEHAAGRVAEALGDWSAAGCHYRRALAARPRAEDVSSYRLALARALAIGGGGVPPPPDLDEALRLADEVVRAGNEEGRLVKAHVCVLRRQWGAALGEYAAWVGRRTPGDSAAFAGDLRLALESHPALNPPPAARQPSPALAAANFEAGRKLYLAGKYAEAEAAFRDAVYHNAEDARFWYFLGLAQRELGKPDATLESFRQGKRLEERRLPRPDDVTGSLEKVQGDARQALIRYRDEP
jgi:hypothetical protein